MEGKPQSHQPRNLKVYQFKRHFIPLFILFILASYCLDAKAENYPQFRGENGDAISETPLPTRWSNEGPEKSQIRWKIALTGEGWSQPIVWGDRVYMTAAVPKDSAKLEVAGPEVHRGGYGRDRNDLVNLVYLYQVICLDADTGTEVWRRTVKEGKPPMSRHSTNTYATETPVTDGKFIYAYFGMNGVHCLDMNGSVAWTVDLGTYEMRAGWGTASSPTILGSQLFVQVDNQEQSFLVSLNTATGSEIWRVNRDEKSQYSSPLIWKNSLRTELIVGGTIYRSYAPESGELLWEIDMDKGRSSATPLAVGDRLFLGNEFRNRGGEDDGGGRLYCIKPGGAGDITPTDDAMSGKFVQWRMDDSDLQMASPTYCQGNLYFFERRTGNMKCVDAKTGKIEYRKRVPGARAFWASPWSDGKQVFALDSSGNTHVLAAGDQPNIVATNRLEEMAWGTPAIANGRIYLRTVDHLYCIE